MDMDAMEELSGSNDHTMIMKSKSNKRQRPLSSVGRLTSSSSSGGGEKSGCSDGGDLYNSLVPSSSCEISTSTEEDEDMANCLILLAQGGCSIKQDQEEEIKMEKFSSSRRFNEMFTTSTTAKAGFYVYECKTCNRTFPSFQALGGHRASHKKPKPMVEEKKVVTTVVSVDQEEEEKDGRQFSTRPNDTSQSMELSNKASHGNNKMSKMHECSICGSEFSSGQALGGHMRRHRNPTVTKPTIDTNTIDHSEKPTSVFPLDLNLPAPEDYDHQDLKFQYSANQQHLVFSAPALVDCHY